MLSTSGFCRRRPLFWLAVCFCAGICFDPILKPTIFILTISVVACIAAGIAAAIWLRRAAFAAGILAAVCLGMLTHASRARIGAADELRRVTPERTCIAWVRGTIEEADWRGTSAAPGGERPAYTHWTVGVEALGDGAESMRRASGKMRVVVRLPVPGAEVLAEGDRVEFRARVEPLPVSTLPDGFDYGAFLAGQGVRRVGIAEPGTVRKVSGLAWWHVGLRLRRFSGELAATSETLLRGNAEQAGLLNAMVFGRRETLSATDREAFAISGTAHLLAISGLHLYLVCWLGWHAVHALGMTRRKAAGLVLAACVAYCLLTGSSPPAVRSTVMLGTYLLATIFWRDSDPLSALALAALAILCVEPQQLFSVGFQLSFMAVFALNALMPAFNEYVEQWRVRRIGPVLEESELPTPPPRWRLRFEWLGKWALRAILATLCAWLATAPAVAWHMGRFSTLSLLVNLFALPLLGACMIVGGATLVAGIFSTALGMVLGWAALAVFWILEALTRVCAALPMSSVDLPRPAVATMVIFAGLMGWIWIAHSRRGDVRGLWVIVAVCPLILLSNVFFRTKPSGTELTIFDLGRGRSALLETPQGAALIDAGGKGQGLRLAEALRRRGTSKLALLVVTSDEPDAIDGALEVAAHLPPGRVIFPRCKSVSGARRKLEALLSEKGIAFGTPQAAEEIAGLRGVRWEFSDDGPAAGQPAANNSVLCVRIAAGAFTALLADAKSSASLKRLLAKRAEGWSADVLRLFPGDAGSWPRETNELIERARSRIIVAGTTADAEELPGVDFDALSARTYSPHTDGSIRIRTGAAGEMEVWGYWGEWRRVK